jgi:AraC family transcriptional regulator
VSIGRIFRSVVPKERIRGLWESEAGLAFIQRGQTESGFWEAPQADPTGLYHTVIHFKNCVLSAKFNGRTRYDGHLSARSIQFACVDEKVRCAGIGPLEFLQVSFTPEFLADHLESLHVNADVVELRRLQSTDDVGLAHLAEAYEVVLSRGMPVTQLYFDIIRQAIVYRIVLRHATRPITGSVPEILVPAKARRVIDYVEANLTRDLRLVDLCAVAGVSRAHFARAFRNTIGMAPHAFVLQRRLAQAVELLALRVLPVGEVAQRCGFADPAHLARAFKSRFGYAPSLHRRRL